ncbi:MAG: response regulator [Chloroflexota bacterium]|nr:response regulator [Chloroflexota bacterium]
MSHGWEVPDAPAPHTPAKMILVVEDNEAIGQMIVQILSLETPYQAYLVQDSLDALEAAQDVRPHLLLLDYYLPHMTGLQLYDELCIKQKLAAIPAIIISANLPVQELKTRHIIGLDKPFDLDALLDAIERLLR